MSKIQNTKSNLVNHKEYIDLLTGIKARIQSARIAASRSVSRELIFLYWDIGRAIVERQKDESWGKSVVEQLSKDIQKEFPGTTGYSVNNLWRMRQLYLEYASSDFLAQAVPEMKKVLSKVRHTQRPSSENITFLAQAVPELNDGDIAQLMRQLVAEIPWGHNVLVLQKTKAVQERLYYVMASACFGWSRSVLLNQIKAQAYERTMLEGKSHNFSAVMPVHLAEQAEEAMKSSYNEELSNKLIAVANDLLRAKGYISHVDVFMKLDYLDLKDYNAWRMKQIPYLERVIKVNLGTISFIMKFILKHAEDKGLKESWTDYSSWGKGKRVKLRFSKSGEVTIEKAYANHLVLPKSNNKTQDQNQK